MLERESIQQPEQLTHEGEVNRRRQFIERMERKLAHKTAVRRRQRQQFRVRLLRARSWQ
ncbi:MAG TPA: hypothetical protein VGG13_03305 [Candidatus Saccharimonadales bacterium]